MRSSPRSIGPENHSSLQLAHSGPYSDISITETSSGAGCINITQGGQPRGIHGVDCTSSSNSNAGIYLDGNNVSLEDIYVNDFGDGIRIGSQGPSAGNVIFNVTGGSNITDVVHICGSNAGTNACSQTSNYVADLTLMGITSSANNTIQDDVSGTLLSQSTDPTVGMYILGESVAVSGSVTGYSRFTTSPSIPTWRVGTDDPPKGNCAVGTLYSRTSNSSTQPPTVWGCVGGLNPWSSIK